MAAEKSEKSKNIFIQEKQAEFSHLEEKFEKMTDPIERFIKRQEMMKIQKQLMPMGVKLEIP